MNEIQRKAYQKINEIKDLTPEIVEYFFANKRYFRCFRDMGRAEKICRMRLQGKTYKEIASIIGKSAGIPRETIHKVLRCYKSAKYRELSKIKPSNKERIQSMSTRELAEFLVHVDRICFKSCEDATGDIFRCPYEDDDCNVRAEQCIQCHIKYLESESDTK